VNGYVGERDDGTPFHANGVFFSDRPTWDGGYCGDPPEGWCILVVEIPEEVTAEYEFLQEDCPYREWCIPAALANHYFVGEETA
jgi:hypothetical protein